MHAQLFAKPLSKDVRLGPTELKQMSGAKIATKRVHLIGVAKQTLTFAQKLQINGRGHMHGANQIPAQSTVMQTSKVVGMIIKNSVTPRTNLVPSFATMNNRSVPHLVTNGSQQLRGAIRLIWLAL
jgi:ethanolamine utilization protein EutP (predicted NTPase)